MSVPVVIKLGGNALVDPACGHAFAQAIAGLVDRDIYPIIVHGAGPAINEVLLTLGVESSFHNGLRVTTPEAIRGIEMALLSVAQQVLGFLRAYGVRALSLTGQDGDAFLVERGDSSYGLVGTISSVRGEFITGLLEQHIIPVISSIGPDGSGQVLNVNADLAAGAIAAHVGARKLYVLTDVAGVYGSWPDRDSLIDAMTADQLAALLPSLAAGMIPKTQACLDAVRAGVSEAWIIDGRDSAIVLDSLVHGIPHGTRITPST